MKGVFSTQDSNEINFTQNFKHFLNFEFERQRDEVLKDVQAKGKSLNQIQTWKVR